MDTWNIILNQLLLVLLHHIIVYEVRTRRTRETEKHLSLLQTYGKSTIFVVGRGCGGMRLCVLGIPPFIESFPASFCFSSAIFFFYGKRPRKEHLVTSIIMLHAASVDRSLPLPSVISAISVNSTMPKADPNKALTFLFRGSPIPVKHAENISAEVASLALESEIFCMWRDRSEQENNGKRLELHSVEIQSVDLFGERYVIHAPL